MGASDIDLVNQSKGAGFNNKMFLGSDGSNHFVLKQVKVSDLDYTGLTNFWYPYYDSASGSLIDGGGSYGIQQASVSQLNVQATILKLGDSLNIGSSNCITVDDSSNNIIIDCRDKVQIGDVSNLGGNTRIEILDGRQEIYLYSNGGTCVIGDVAGVGNSTQLGLDDAGRIINLTANTIIFSNYTTNGVLVTRSGIGQVSLITTTGLLTFLTTPSSANLAAFITDVEGSGKVLFNAAITSFGLRDTSAAFDLKIGAASSTALTAGRKLTFDVVNVDRTIKLAGNLTIGTTLILNGTSGTTMTFPATSTTVAGLSIGTSVTPQTFTGICAFNVGANTGQGVAVTGTSGPLNSIGDTHITLDFGIATSAGFFSNAAAAGDAVLRRQSTVGSSHMLIISNASGAGIKFCTGTLTSNDTQKMYLSQAGGLYIGTATTDAGANNLQTAGKIIAGAQINLKNYTVATLPVGTRGDTAYVTDALAPTFLSIIVGGGAVVSPVFYNGTNWVGY